MLNHFRSLSLEATVLENNNHSLESEAAEVRGALQTARHQILDLERQLADRDCLIKGYETQVFRSLYTRRGEKREETRKNCWYFHSSHYDVVLQYSAENNLIIVRTNKEIQ